MREFTLDPQLKADSVPLCQLELCSVRLMKDANFPWLLMVPKRFGMAEVIDLAKQDQHILMDEIADVSAALRQVTGCDKLNVAALGNMVRQLHVHVIARYNDDAAWPGPIWGKVDMKPYEADKDTELVQKIRNALSGSQAAD